MAATAVGAAIRYRHVDSFTTGALAGNPAAVFLLPAVLAGPAVTVVRGELMA